MENRPRILICDDEPRMTASIKALLSASGYEASTTNDPRHALTLIHAESPDLVIMDIMMPGMTGFEVLESVDRERCDASFIIVTGEASIDSAIKAIRMGANDYLRKPFEPEELLIRVENALDQRQMRLDHTNIQAEKQQLENQLRQSQKMEAIGTLAGGIAHDFNNVLSIILGNTELALATIPKKETARQNLERILTASLRAREMIQQLLRFSRKEESGRKPLQLNHVVGESLKLMRASLPTNIAIETDISAAELTAVADATQIHQIMLNLCTNAAHAMASGGVLTIRLEPVLLDRTAGIEGLDPGSYARLIVADTGHGIEKNIIDRIFDPYFTTKETGKGTGMGLSVVHGIVKSSGGDIRVFSNPGQYTEFHIYLPTVDTVIDEKPADLGKQLPGGGEHILLVDDEEMLVDMMQQVLEQLGYTVSAHADSSTAFNAFRSQPLSYDLLITDMTMPGMNGIELTRALKAVRADLPVILCTGFNEQISEKNAQSMGVQALLMKPVGMQQLAETIRSVLLPVSTERRKDPRFLAPPGSFVISRTNPYARCSLVDIGRSGLAFSHEMESSAANPSDRLAIMTPDGELFLNDIPCRIVSDIPAGSGIVLTEAEQQARRSVCFENLSLLQMEQIDHFIHNHATRLLH
ncbi:response regulator [uncultured Desulfosarcina sp.]|uniref:response regulator n=1 Tax=uncultured Desulfosarcina sp. TaxID=218289 RepID=UPI0029C7DBF0|nr:response regulator [uncultured Desulfosarcina sp.]